MKFSSSRFLIFLVVAILFIAQSVAAQVVEIPDPNLERALREALELPDGVPITQQEMLKLRHLKAPTMGIADLTGLEYATNLESLRAWENFISDLTPLANLTKLKVIDLSECHISDLTPLENLTQLELLNLPYNRITDIQPLAKLTQLKFLRIDGNNIVDISPLEGLSLIRLRYDEVCELPSLPIEQRIKNRTFPSIFSAWEGARVKNQPELSKTEKLALHDLHWHRPYFKIRFSETNELVPTGKLKTSLALRDELLALNPNMIFIAVVSVRDEFPNIQPEDWPHWLRDENGNRVPTPSGTKFLVDFTQRHTQDMIVQQVIAVAKCGLFDGVFFDWFHEHFDVLTGYYSLEEELRAKDNILQRIRAAVPDNFLIIINTNRAKIPRKAWGINGTFMETLRDNQWNPDKEPYTHEGIKEIEDTLLWAEENLREPQINCLEGWGIPTEPPDSPDNLRWMRVFTTMSLTLSDGYVLYGMEDSHQHIWYDFWNADLGRPIGAINQQYQDINGLFIREFTNGWAVYNRSGKTQTITLPRVSTGVSSNKQDITHLLPDLDGEIYLRKGKPFDLNRDGTVNVLDLIIVAQSFGSTEGDINGNGTTDILDLTLVAQQFRK